MKHNLCNNYSDIVRFSTHVVVIVILACSFGKWWEVSALNWILLGLWCNNLCNKFGIGKVIWVSNERPNKLYHFHVKEVIPEAIWTENHNIFISNIMYFGVCLCRIISTSSYLEWEVKTVLLFLWSEKFNQIKTFLSQQHVSRVTDISSIHQRSLFIESSQYTCATSDFSIIINSLN